MNRVAIALGSNLGDREGHLAFAVRSLGDIVAQLRVSTFHDTAPVGVSGEQPRYLNAAAAGETTLAPRVLLQSLMAIEWARGRTRPHVNAPRTLDLDLIFYGDAIVEESGLRIPHPRFRERLFVLEPLAEIAGDWVDPETGETVAALLDRARAATRK